MENGIRLLGPVLSPPTRAVAPTNGPTMTLRTSRYPPGTRVEIVRGSFPMDPSLVGRAGLVVETDEYRPGRYGVQLDGETEVRDLLEEELVPTEA